MATCEPACCRPTMAPAPRTSLLFNPLSCFPQPSFKLPAGLPKEPAATTSRKRFPLCTSSARDHQKKSTTQWFAQHTTYQRSWPQAACHNSCYSVCLAGIRPQPAQETKSRLRECVAAAPDSPSPKGEAADAVAVPPGGSYAPVSETARVATSVGDGQHTSLGSVFALSVLTLSRPSLRCPLLAVRSLYRHSDSGEEVALLS